MHVISQWGTQKISCHIINSVLSYLSYALLLLPAVRVGEVNKILTTLVYLIIVGPNALFSTKDYPGLLRQSLKFRETSSLTLKKAVF